MSNYFHLEVSDSDGSRSMVGRLFDSVGNEVDELKEGVTYEGELEFFDGDPDKLSLAIEGIQSRLIIAKELSDLFASYAYFPPVVFKGVDTQADYVAVVPKDVVSLESTELEEKTSLGILISKWAVDPSVFVGRDSAFYECLMDWLVDEEFKSCCEKRAAGVFKFESVRLL